MDASTTTPVVTRAVRFRCTCGRSVARAAGDADLDLSDRCTRCRHRAARGASAALDRGPVPRLPGEPGVAA